MLVLFNPEKIVTLPSASRRSSPPRRWYVPAGVDVVDGRPAVLVVDDVPPPAARKARDQRDGERVRVRTDRLDDHVHVEGELAPLDRFRRPAAARRWT